MANITEGIRFFKPSGEPISIPGEKVESIGPHPSMGGTVVFLSDGKVIHTDLPFYVISEAEKLEELAEDIVEEGE